MSLLLGIDEGTSAVKAVVFDSDLKPVKEARREKPLIHPKPGWVEQDPEVIVDAVVGAVGELLQDEPDMAACGLDHQGESVLAWDAETGEALTTVVTWQDKRSQEILDRLEAEGQRRGDPQGQRDAARPVLLRREARLAAGERRRRRQGRRRGDGAARDRRLVPLRSSRRRVRNRPVDRVAHPARRARVGRRQSVRREGRLQAGHLHDRPSRASSGWRSTRTPARCGRPRTARTAATRSTSSSRAATTAGRSSATAATTTGRASARRCAGHGGAASSSGCRRSRRRA